MISVIVDTWYCTVSVNESIIPISKYNLCVDFIYPYIYRSTTCRSIGTDDGHLRVIEKSKV